jgi:hypothetical protein
LKSSIGHLAIRAATTKEYLAFTNNCKGISDSDGQAVPRSVSEMVLAIYQMIW